MKSDCSAPSWLKFFMSAGIQKDSAETYAVTFSKNQIQLDMLPEIKKEYLVDMGITLMGHIIAILRHAKTVHTEEVTKSTLSTTKSGSSVTSKTATTASKPVSKTTPLLVKDKAQPPSTVSKPAASAVKPVPPAESTRSAAKMGPKLPPKPSESSTSTEKRRASSPVVDIMVTRVSGPSRPLSSTKSPESPVKRKLASDESSHADESESKKRIFQRLGQVTNTSSPDPPTNGESVFSRLGQKTPEPPKPAVSAPKVIAIPQHKVTVLPQKVSVLSQKVTVKPIISIPKSASLTKNVPLSGVVTRSNSSSTMIADPKQKVMMLNRGVLTKTMRADQDVPSKVLSSTSLSAEHTSQTIQSSRVSKNNIYARLGKAAMDQELKKPAAVSKVKRVSFGTVSEKTIPPVARASFPFGERTSPVGFAPYKRKSIGANGVFSRLGI